MLKAAISAFVSVVLGVVLGYGMFALLAPGGYSGRDATPLVVIAALFLVLSGFAYGKWFLRGGPACFVGLALYAMVVGLLVAVLGGTEAGYFFFEWVCAVLAVTLAPWALGLWLGRYAQRFKLS